MTTWWAGDTDRDLPLQRIAPAVPYLAVLVGMHWVSSAWLSIGLYHTGILLVLWRAGYWQVGPPLKTAKDFLVMLGVMLVSTLSGVWIYTCWPVLKLEQLSLAAELAKQGLTNGAWPLFIGYYFTVNPLLEELFWRGYLGSDRQGLTWNDLWFGGYHLLILVFFAHWFWIVVSTLLLVATAWVWRQLARRYDGLMLPIASHAAADASIITAVYLLAWWGGK